MPPVLTFRTGVKLHHAEYDYDHKRVPSATPTSPVTLALPSALEFITAGFINVHMQARIHSISVRMHHAHEIPVQ